MFRLRPSVGGRRSPDPDGLGRRVRRHASGTERQTTQRGFVHALEDVLGAKHRYIPPSCPNANADVESAHNLIEQEFFALEHFGSLDEFLEKAALYQHYFNYVRPNSYKSWRTPWQITREERADLPASLLRFEPLLLDSLLRRWQPSPEMVPVGHDVPVDPAVIDGGAPQPRSVYFELEEGPFTRAIEIATATGEDEIGV